jgi:hypothetical protein
LGSFYKVKNFVNNFENFLLAIFNNFRFGVNKEDFPNVSRVYDNFGALEEVVQAMPENQPEWEDRSKPKVEPVEQKEDGEN